MCRSASSVSIVASLRPSSVAVFAKGLDPAIWAVQAHAGSGVLRAHRLAVEALRSGPGDYPVGLTISMAEITAEAGGESLRDAAEEVLENIFLRATAGDDFVGVQCYTRMHFGPDGQAPNDPSVPVTQMDDERWPRAVEFCVRRAAAISGRPVVVTENGIATADDADRIAFLSEAIESARSGAHEWEADT